MLSEECLALVPREWLPWLLLFVRIHDSAAVDGVTRSEMVMRTTDIVTTTIALIKIKCVESMD